MPLGATVKLLLKTEHFSLAKETTEVEQPFHYAMLRRTEGEKLKGRWSRSTWPSETSNSRDFIAGEESGIDAYLPNISLQFINV